MALEVTTVNSRYSNHILNAGHAYGTIADTMEIITTGKKGKYLNTPEKYYTFNKTRRENLHIKDTHNPIFEKSHEIYTQ
jgi:hypothetical protein